MIILGIETSCDETALALIETRTVGSGAESPFECRVIQSLVHSQAELHSAYGGVYPNLAKREHGTTLVPLLQKLLAEAGPALAEIAGTKASAAVDLPAALEPFRADVSGSNPELFEAFSRADFLARPPAPAIDCIAVTEGPGLEPTLWVGITFARMLAALWHVPVMPVDHMEGHIVGSLLESDKPSGTWQKLKNAPLPAVALLVSGGHTELVKIPALGSYEIIGQTKDDAVGEAFDKVARLLGLPYPGGPQLSRLAEEAEAERLPSPVALPRPMIKSGDLNFSFSGLKTAVLYAVRKGGDPALDGALPESFKKGLAHEFETAVADTLDSKVRGALEQTGGRSLILGGGVSANRRLRSRLTSTAAEYGIPLFLPSPHISGDNALMIALAGALSLSRGQAAKTPGSLRAHGTKKLGFEK